MNMKRNQKTLALLLVFMLFASMLSACVGRASTPQTRGYLDSDGITHIISDDDTDDDGVYDGPDDSEDGPAPAVPGFTGTEKAELIAPYMAQAIEYNGCIYYLDSNVNLCRADANMQNNELVLAQPLGDDIDHAYICGVTNSGVMYIGSPLGSCYLDVNSGELWPLTFTISHIIYSLQLFGISGEWMYYSTDYSDDYLYRCKLGGAFDTEEKVFDFTVEYAALTKEHIVMIHNDDEGRALSYQRLDNLQKSWQNEIARVSYDGSLGILVVYDELVAYIQDEARGKLNTINLKDSTAHSGLPVSIYPGVGYDAENDELVYFFEALYHIPVQEIEAGTVYRNPNGYQSSDNLQSGIGAGTVVRNWFFFRGYKNAVDRGENYFIDLDGMTLTKLD